jgi:penicillin-binding protein 1A
MSPRTGKIMTELLAGVVQRGTATRVQVLNRPMGGKTGTTNNHRDAWFIGFTPSVTTGVWIGLDDERSLGSRETGGQAAAPIFIRFMQEALKNQPVEKFSDVPATVFASSQRRQVDYEASDHDEDSSQGKPSAKKNFFKRDVE